MLEKLLRQAAPASRAQANDLPSNNTYMYIMLARYIVVLFIVLSYYSHEIESKRENIREKTSRRVGVCQNTDRFRFEAKQPQRRNDLGFCQQYRSARAQHHTC